MRGCARTRALLRARPEAGCEPAAALEAARHLAVCAACRLDGERQESLVRALESLPQVEPPEGLAAGVMARLRAMGPLARRAGACLLLATAGTGAAAASLRVSAALSDLFPRIGPWVAASWEVAVELFGRALLAMLSGTVAGRTPTAWPFLPHALPGGAFAASLALGAVILLAATTLILAVASPPRAGERPACGPSAGKN